MKCAILIINNLSCGLPLLTHILNDTDSFSTKAKDGHTVLQFNWKCLIGFECLHVVISNPTLTQLFAQSSISIGVPVLL